jgi:hypothetical protein
MGTSVRWDAPEAFAFRARVLRGVLRGFHSRAKHRDLARDLFFCRVVVASITSSIVTTSLSLLLLS